MRRITAWITARIVWACSITERLLWTERSRIALASGSWRGAEACERLEAEAVFQGKLKFNRNSMEVFVNDRLLAPNTGETWTHLRPELQTFFPDAKIERLGEPRDLFRVAVSTP